MAEENESAGERSEEATPERREEFREKGQVASSRELTSVVTLAALVAYFSIYGSDFLTALGDILVKHIMRIKDFRVTAHNIIPYFQVVIYDSSLIILPVLLVAAVVATAVTLIQTQFNFSWTRISFDVNRIDPLKGFIRLFSSQSIVELFKGLAKITAIGFVSYLVFKAEWSKVPGLLNYYLKNTFRYWAEITEQLFWGAAMLMVGVAGADFFYNFMTLEGRLRMTKQEVKEDYKKRESDPHVKAKIRRMQRDFATRRVLEKTKEASVLITNPTNFAIAVKYELGMGAPIVLAKGMDFLALRMRETAKEAGIPIVENKPLARTLYKMVNEGQEIPESLYKAVSEVIRYVFRLKGISVKKNRTDSKNNERNI